MTLNKLNSLDPKLKATIESITELDSNKFYIVEISSNIPREKFKIAVEHLSKAFDTAGVKCIIIPANHLIANIYELERDNNDSGTSIK